MKALSSFLLGVFCVICLVESQTVSKEEDELFPLSIIHINDFHARFEPTDSAGGTCNPDTEKCIGGYARTVHTVKRLLKKHENKNPVYLNAGDNFQGTLWYNIGRWNVTSQFLNMLPADAVTLGNHEFDHGVPGVVPFLENLKSPMLVVNINDTAEPTMTGKYKKSTVIERSGRKIGIIGVILETTYDLANTGKLKFLNETETIRAEAELLRKQHPDLNIIIVVSHCGYDVDQVIAKNVGPDVDIIVGAHSHTFLYTGDKPPGPDRPGGPYPTEVVQEHSGHKVLIVQAGAYAKYVGDFTTYFNAEGEIVWHEGAPLYMGSDVPQDVEVLTAIKPWKEIIDEQGLRVIGETKVDLDKASCSSGECNLGNFFSDAMVHAFVKNSSFEANNWSNVSIGLTNSGGLRVPLKKGNLTYSHLVTMSPFENTLTAFNIYGKHLIEALEYSVSPIDVSKGATSSWIMLQVSGLKVTYDVRKPVGSRVVRVLARCSQCRIPKYEAVKEDSIYRIVATSFLVGGGDGFHMIRDNSFDIETFVTDLDALLDYVETHQPITTPLEGRIRIRSS